MSNNDHKNLEEIIKPVVREYFDTSVKSCKKFRTGLCHFVYDIRTINGDKFVFRIASQENKKELEGYIFWYKNLENLGIKIPKLLYSELSCKKYHLPFIVIERLSGVDIGNIIDKLDDSQIRSIAKQIVELQKKIETLKYANGYGFAYNYSDKSLKKDYNQFIGYRIQNIMERLIKNGIFDQEYAEKVKFIQEQMKGYFEKVEPKAFLDDLTNKNVVIYRGKLSGIIDFDTISFGDRLSWLGLTCLAFEELGNSSYGEYLFNFLGYKNEDKKILNFYRLLYILEFMSEQGEKFNKNKINLDSIRIERLKKLFGKYYKLIN